MSELVKAHWSLQLYFDCPKCGDSHDYMNSIEYCSEDGWEGMPDALEKGKHDIRCDCGHRMTLDIQEGL